MSYLNGVKMKMSQIFQGDLVIPVTPVLLEAAPESGVEVGVKIKVIGVTKGRGFQGGVKRWGFHGGPKTHGQKDRLRAPGSIGSTAPQRVTKGHKMAGHMGVDKKTVKDIKVIAFDPEKKIVSLKGALPGRIGGKLKLYI